MAFQANAFQSDAFQITIVVPPNTPFEIVLSVSFSSVGVVVEARPVITVIPSASPLLTVSLSMPRIIPYRTRTNIDAAFTDVDGNPVDPGTVRFSIVKPDGTLLAYDDGDSEIDNPEVGTFRFEVLLDQVGEWRYRWESADVGEESSAQDTITVPRLNT